MIAGEVEMDSFQSTLNSLMMERTTVRQRQEHRAVRLDPEHLISRSTRRARMRARRRRGKGREREDEVLITWVNQLG
jgi:hypothetical protein